MACELDFEEASTGAVRLYTRLYLHKIAVEEGSLGQDKVGTDAAGYSLLNCNQLLLSQVNA